MHFYAKQKKRREGMFALFENLTNWLWGLPLLITILVTGIYLTIRSGFFQFRHFGHIIKNMFSKERREEGGDDGKSLTPFQAISIAIGGTVGNNDKTNHNEFLFQLNLHGFRVFETLLSV